MSDKDNNIVDLVGDALDEALMAAIEETEEEERAARELKAKENQERAEQARVTAIEQEERKAKIDKLRQSLPNEGRRYFLEQAPIDHLPIYIKAGSIIPVYEEMQYVGEKPMDKLTLITTPEGGSAVHYQDGGEDFSYLEGNYNLYRFDVDKDKNLSAEMLNEATDVKQYDKIRVVSV